MRASQANTYLKDVSDSHERSFAMRLITRLALVFALSLSSLLFSSSTVTAQEVDRAQLLREIVALRADLILATDPTQKTQIQALLKTKELLFLAPSATDTAQFATFLQQPYTGILRLMPREQFGSLLNTRGGGAYYSFASFVHDYGYGSDLSLEQGYLKVGFAGADFGFLVKLGNVSLDSVTMDTPGADYLASFVPPVEEAAAREQYQRGIGFSVNGFAYASRLTAELGATYVLRSVGYGANDILVVFQPFRRDTDGSLLLAWKVLKRYPTQTLSGQPILTVSAASYAHSKFAAGTIATLFGKDLADGTYQASNLPLPQFFGKTQVNVQDSQANRRAALLSATPDQINFIIPPETTEGYALISVTTPSGKSYREIVNIAKAAPGLFSANASGKGIAAAVALRINGSQQTYEPVARYETAQGAFVSAPIDLGSGAEQVYLLLFGTGVRGRSSLSAVSVRINGIDAPVTFAGEQGSPGLDQINVALPRALAGSGEVDVSLLVDGKTANTVRINIK